MFENKSDREKKVIILMIPNGEGWHYLAVKIVCIIQRNNV